MQFCVGRFFLVGAVLEVLVLVIEIEADKGWGLENWGIHLENLENWRRGLVVPD